MMLALMGAVPVRLALVGDIQSAPVEKWLGGGYEVHRYVSLEAAARDNAEVVVFQPKAELPQWKRRRDSFVPMLEHQWVRFTRSNPQARLYAVLPTSPGPSEDPSFLTETEVVPLMRQAALESGVAFLQIEGSKDMGQAIAAEVFNFAAEKKEWKIVSVDSEEPGEGEGANALDGKQETYWHTRYSPKTDAYPHQITVDMGRKLSIAGFRYVPRQDGGSNGRVARYQFFLSVDGTTWSAIPAAEGVLPNTSSASMIWLPEQHAARYFKFVALSEQNGGPWASAAEIDVFPGQ